LSTFSSYQLDDVESLRGRVGEAISRCGTLQEAAQVCVTTLFDEFSESAVLFRFFATMAFAVLPEPDRSFVTGLAHSRGVLSELKDETCVVTLLGTRGRRPNWNDRHKSERRLCVPLLSASFIQTIPVVARLMTDVDQDVDWLSKQTTRIMVKTMGTMSRIVYVDDAGTAETEDHFKIIPSQDFVAANGVKTVLGLGGSYLGGSFMTLILFTREAIALEQVSKFTPLVHTIKSATMSLVMNHKIL